MKSVYLKILYFASYDRARFDFIHPNFHVNCCSLLIYVDIHTNLTAENLHEKGAFTAGNSNDKGSSFYKETFITKR